MAPARQNDIGRHLTCGLEGQVAGRGQQEEPFIFVFRASASGAGADAAGDGQGLDEVGGERKWEGGFEGWNRIGGEGDGITVIVVSVE